MLHRQNYRKLEMKNSLILFYRRQENLRTGENMGPTLGALAGGHAF